MQSMRDDKGRLCVSRRAAIGLAGLGTSALFLDSLGLNPLSANAAGTGTGSVGAGGNYRVDGPYTTHSLWFDNSDEAAKGKPIQGWGDASIDYFKTLMNNHSMAVSPNGPIAWTYWSVTLGMTYSDVMYTASHAAIANAIKDHNDHLEPNQPPATMARVVGVGWADGPTEPRGKSAIASYPKTFFNMLFAPGDASMLQGSGWGTEFRHTNMDWRTYVWRHNGELNGGTKARIFVVAVTNTDPPSNGKVHLNKQTRDHAISDGNPLYVLNNAVYGVFSDARLTNRVATLTTNAAGNTNTVELKAGTYYVSEITPSTGYWPDPDMDYTKGRYKRVDLPAGQTINMDSKEPPIYQIADFGIQKVDAREYGRGSGNPVGDTSLDGAEFRVNYYNNRYTTVGALPQSPTKTWTLRTSGSPAKTGLDSARRDSNYLVSAPNGWYESGNRAVLPLGTVTVQETKPPTGYEIADDAGNIVPVGPIHLGLVTKDSKPAWQNWNIAMLGESAPSRAQKNRAIEAGIELTKLDADSGTNEPQGEATLEGAEFTLTNSSQHAIWYADASGVYKPIETGNTVDVFPTDARGHFETSTTALTAYASYDLRETKPPRGYKLNSDWGGVFDLSGTKNTRLDVATALGPVKNSIIRAGIALTKLDVDSQTPVPQGDMSMAGAKFRIWNRSTHSIWYKKGGALKKIGPGEIVDTLVTDAHGDISTGIDALPAFAKYEVREVEPPHGYILNTTWGGTFMLSDYAAEGNVLVRLENVFGSIMDASYRYNPVFYKHDYDSSSSVAQGDATLAGAQIRLWNRSIQDIYYGPNGNRKRIAPGEIVDTLVTNSAGLISVSFDAMPIVATYEAREIVAPAGYEINKDWGCVFMPDKFINGDVEHSQGFNLPNYLGPIHEKIYRGSVNIRKIDSVYWRDTAGGLPDIKQETGQADAVLEGAEFRIYNVSKSSVKVRGKWYKSVGQITLGNPFEAEGRGNWLSAIRTGVAVDDNTEYIVKLTTDERGICRMDDLPYGTYLVREIKAPTGYSLNQDWNTGVVFSIRKPGQVIDLASLLTDGYYNGSADEPSRYEFNADD